MNFFRKLFDIAVEAAPGQGIVSADIAAMLAKSGVRTETGITATVPDIKVEQPPAQPAPASPAPAALPTEIVAPPAAAPTPATPPTPEVPQPPVIPITPPVAASQQPAAQIDWKEVLKANTPDTLEVLKTIGFDDKMAGFFHAWKNGGDIKQYLQAATTDFSKMSNEDLMKYQLHRDFGEIPTEDFDLLYQMKVVEQYKLDPANNTEDEIRRGKVLLNADAMKVRLGLIEDQKKFILDSKPPDAAPAAKDIEAEKRIEQAKAEWNTYLTTLESDAFTKSILATKIFPVGDKDTFNYESTNPQAYIDAITDGAKWKAKLMNSDGTPNIKKQLLVSLVVNDDNFLGLYAQHHQKIGAAAAVLPLENPSATTGTGGPNTPELPTNPAAALAKAGVITGY